MGYGSGEGFSACSVQSFNEYFGESEGLTCLSDPANDFSSNYEDDAGGDIAPTPPPAPSPTPPPVPNPTPRPTASSNTNWNCVGISGMSSTWDVLNGNWRESGTNDG